VRDTARSLGAALCLTLALGACSSGVSQKDFDSLEQERNEWRRQAAELRAELDQTTDDLAASTTREQELTARAEVLTAQVDQALADLETLQADLDIAQQESEARTQNLDRVAVLSSFLGDLLLIGGNAGDEEAVSALFARADDLGDETITGLLDEIGTGNQEAYVGLVGYLLDQIAVFTTVPSRQEG
jgi:septal ring factor EnvC (AmiA/AmiB activator)